MAATIIWLGPLLSGLLTLLLIIVAIKFGGGLLWLIINSLVGLAILILLNFLPVIQIPINIWTVLIVALGGLPGIILLVILNLLGIVIA